MDIIEHYGNKNSGRYPRGSGKNPKGAVRVAIGQAGRDIKSGVRGARTKIKKAKEAKKFEKTVEKRRVKNEKYLAKGLKKLDKMSPKEADAFFRKSKRKAKGDALAQDRLKMLAEAKMRDVSLTKAKIEAIDAVMKISKTSLSLAKKISSKPEFKDLTDGITAVSKTSKRIEKEQQKKLKDLGQNVKVQTSPSQKAIDRYVKMSKVNAKTAANSIKNYRDLEGGGKDVLGKLAGMFAEEEKRKKGGK